MKKLILAGFIFFLGIFCYADPIPDRLLGDGKLPRDVLVDFLLRNNPYLDKFLAEDIVAIYISEARDEGVNYEIAFAQMCYHTNYLRFENTIARAGSNNFYGCLDSPSYGNYVAYKFASIREGVRAHIQHLKGYATDAELVNRRVDPRYFKIEEVYGWGSAPRIDDLSSKWASDTYADDIKAILNKLYQSYTR